MFIYFPSRFICNTSRKKLQCLQLFLFKLLLYIRWGHMYSSKVRTTDSLSFLSLLFFLHLLRISCRSSYTHCHLHSSCQAMLCRWFTCIRQKVSLVHEGIVLQGWRSDLRSGVRLLTSSSKLPPTQRFADMAYPRFIPVTCSCFLLLMNPACTPSKGSPNLLYV